jgi:hypothetical protein
MARLAYDEYFGCWGGGDTTPALAAMSAMSVGVYEEM